jgi:putative protease
MQKAELLLPVGDINMCLAAIHNGADAIYVGMPGFNARGRSKDFDLTELKEMIDMCHLYGVKVHLAFNVLIFENELAQAIELLKQVIPLGVDAFIVQDLGLVQIIKMLAPTQVVHGSTQMTVTNHNAIAFLDDLGIKRFVLGRENSIDEIKIIRENTTKELEVFVHGALCVAYSGQCLTSEAIGGRSANRGQCAQSCRFSYEMLVDGKKIALNEKKYLVSPQDLCGIEHVATLQEIGVDSFKIEGRLKTPQYVAVTARHYKNVMQGLPSNEQMQHEMAMTYSRGFFSGWLKGVDHQRLARADYSAHRGQFIGTVNKNSNNKISIETKTELQAGDGLLIVQHGQEMGGKIFDLKKDKCYEIILKDFKTTQDLKGASVYKNSDPKLFSQLEKSFTGKDLLKKIPIHITLKAAVGEKLTLIYEDGLNIVERVSEEELQPAMTELNREQVAAEISADRKSTRLNSSHVSFCF